MVLDGFGLKGRLVFHALFWRSGRGPVLLMWSRSDLMTITVARFGSAALSRELLPILCLVQKMFPIMFLLPLSFSQQITRYRPSGGPQAILAGSYTNPLCVHLRFYFISDSLFLSSSLSLFLSLSCSVYIQMLRSRGEPASELSSHTTAFRLQISQDIQCICEFINTEFEPCLPSSIRVTSRGRTMPNTSPLFPLLSVPFRLALTVTLPPPWGQWPQPLLFLLGTQTTSSALAG